MTAKITIKTVSSNALRLLPLGFGLAMLWFVARRFGVREILRTVTEVRWSLLPVLVLYAGHQMARAAALMMAVRSRTAFGFAEAVWIRLSGEAVECLTFTGPLLSEPTKAWLLKRSGLQMTDGLAATLTEYLSSMVAAATTAVVGVAYVLARLHPGGPVRVAAIGVLVSMSVFVCILATVAATRTPIASTLTRAVTGRTTARLEEIEEAIICTARETPRRFAAIMLAEFVAQGFLALELWALLRSVHVPCPLMRAALMEGVIKFINAASFAVPGQVGVAEGSYAVIFGVFGLPAVAGVTLSFVRHIRTLVTALAGVAALIVMRSPRLLGRDSGPERSARRRRFDHERGQGNTDCDGYKEDRDCLVIDPETHGGNEEDQRKRAVAHPDPDPSAASFGRELGGIRA